MQSRAARYDPGFPAVALRPRLRSPMPTENTPFDLADWFARRTFSHTAFADLDKLSAAKRDAGLTISVCLPARNEAATVGLVVRTLRELMDATDLVDELVVMDGGS